MKRFQKAPIHFSKKCLNQLTNDEKSCVTIQKKSYHLSIHPFQFNDLKSSIKDILANGIAKYNKELDGILLGYQNMKILESIAPIHEDTCFVHINTEAEFFIFKPEIGKVLTGTVNKKSKDHIGCLLHNVFNVSIPKPAQTKEWLGDNVQIGHEISYAITHLNLQARLPFIKAVMISITGGQPVNNANGDFQIHKPKNHKIKFDENEEEIVINNRVNDSVEYDLNESVKHGKEERDEIDQPDNISSDNSIHILSDIQIRSPNNFKHEHSTSDLNNHEESKTVRKKKRKKNKDDIEDMTSLLLEQSLNNVSPNKKVKKERKRNASDTSQELNQLAYEETKPSLNGPKVKKKRKVDINELANSMLEDSLDIHKSKKIKTKNNEEIIENYKPNKKSKSISLDELTNSLLEESLAATNDSLSNKRKTKEKKKKSKKKSVHDNIDDLTNKLLEESLKDISEKEKNAKKVRKSKSNKKREKNNISLDDLNIDALFQEEMRDIMS